MQFEAVIGLEVHVQLKTKTKIFCGCETSFGAAPNDHTCPVCLGMPGVLPVLNKKVAEYAVLCSLATDCTINRESTFDRKNYFYPDLPKGYQITQFENPISEHGHMDIEFSGKTKRIGITRIHIEEDAGKLSHDEGRPLSMVDLNRAGTPLLEIVSEPDMRSPEEAGAYLRKLHAIVKAIGICDGNMQEGSFRCDANVSIRPVGQEKLGTRSELKNLNSFKFLEKAIQYEINRQTHVINEGGEVIQETRLWDAVKNRSNSMRGKENAHDYRYFPEPDLLPLIIDDAWIEAAKKSLPELPHAKKMRFVNDYKLPICDVEVLVASPSLAGYFETVAAGLKKPKLASNWVTVQLLGLLNASEKSIDESPISADKLNELVKLIEADTINAKLARTVFDEMAETGKTAGEIVKDKGMAQVSDDGAIDEIIDRVLAENPKELEAFRGGKTKLMGFFVGQIMKETRGSANPKVVNQRLAEKLK